MQRHFRFASLTSSGPGPQPRSSRSSSSRIAFCSTNVRIYGIIPRATCHQSRGFPGQDEPLNRPKRPKCRQQWGATCHRHRRSHNRSHAATHNACSARMVVPNGLLLCKHWRHWRPQLSAVLGIHSGHSRETPGKERPCRRHCCVRSQAGGDPPELCHQRQVADTPASHEHQPQRKRRQSQHSERPED